MGKSVGDVVLDAALNHVINNVDKMVLCEGEPGDYSAASTLKSGGGSKLGDKSISSSNVSGPVDGDTSGRKLTVNAVTSIAVDEGGDLDHIALIDDGNSDLLHVTTAPTRSVLNGDTIDTDPYDEELEDPS